MKILLPGGAGLVGQNLLNILPDIAAQEADLTEEGDWAQHFAGADAVVMLQSQIGGIDPEFFIRNNIISTQRVLAAVRRYNVPFIVHISSSVVKSIADDDYTRTKTEQEKLVSGSGIPCVILRPSLMFGWFDRKHLGWLSRFMQKVPVFPIPGNGKYMRQPLYAADFCNIIVHCIQHKPTGQVYDITGLEQVDYIDIIKSIKRVTKAKCMIVKIPYGLFSLMLKIYALFDRNPPFTAAQLKALTGKDEFEVIDWPTLFNVKPTPFVQALEKTFLSQPYCNVTLEF